MVAEMLIRVGESGKRKGATVAWMSGTWNKGMTCFYMILWIHA